MIPQSVPLFAANVAQFPSEKRSDASLVAGAAAGDRDAVAAIWDRYSGLVRGVLYGAMGPDQAVEDLVQEVFLSFIRGAARVEDGAALRGYLASTAVRQAAQEIRRRKVRRWVRLSPTGEVPEQPEAPADSENREILGALHRVLERLSERPRMAFVLRQVQGLSVQETTSALGISESTLRRELAAARSFIERAAASEPSLSELISRYEGVSL